MSTARGSMRESMPGGAAAVDHARALLGAELVDQALRNGVALQRTGEPRPGPSMMVREGERLVGAVPVRAAAACPLCGDLHTLSQCRRWTGRADR